MGGREQGRQNGCPAVRRGIRDAAGHHGSVRDGSDFTQTASAHMVHSALDTIVAPFKTAVDASPPEAIKSDLLAMHTAMA